jgi:FkbH-like protein
MSLLSRKLEWRKVLKARPTEVESLRVAVLSTFTAQPAEPFIGMGADDVGESVQVWTGPYDQISAQCLLPGSETELFAPNVLVLWPRLEDVWRPFQTPLVDSLNQYVDALVELCQAGADAAIRWKATLLFVLPAFAEQKPLGVGDASNPFGVVAAAEAARSGARKFLRSAGALVVDAEDTVRRLGVSNALDPRTMTTARVPYSDAMFDSVGRDIGRVLKLARRGAAKVAVVDADNTLWGGVVGEDGAAGIDLLDNGPGEAFKAFQHWLLELRRAGMIIAVASKNNEEDLWAAFARDEMILKREHLAAWRVNWQPKSHNLLELADELNLGVSSFVFIDDNPIEVGAVSELLPEVVALQMPEDPSGWFAVIGASGALDRLPPTAEDIGRAEGYQIETKRREMRAVMTPDEYRRTLNIEVRLADPTSADIGRLSQLVAKTNQFTLGGHRHSEAEIAAIVSDSSWSVRLVSAKDRFGDYGIVGATITKLPSSKSSAADRNAGKPSGGVLDTFVLSCRAMGRGVEDAMVADAVEVSGGALALTVRETTKNIPARSFFATLGAVPGEQTLLVEAPWPDYVRRL